MKITPIKVDHVDHMGSDLSVVNAARVSFDKMSDWAYSEAALTPDPCDPEATFWHNPRALSKADTKLIHYLAKHNHWSPFAHTSIQLRIKAPIFVARQLVKHQVGGVWNEVSRRYVDREPEFYFPEVWRGRPTDGAKQGSSGVVQHNVYANDSAKQTVNLALEIYNELLKCGVAPEQARMILPQNTMTEWIWTGSLMFFARVCKQRLDPHAQAETSEVAQQIANIVRPLFPVSWPALTSNEKEVQNEQPAS
ncbi:FAD-dependent thymidylate synthase [Zoogloea sp.]|uniref:FAD-dependent thymidylate synthase n=1 Tax=Zoogloea sp. TaxID=49181 RepID=UPI00262CA6BB|nr:FAD-dependent thymidylate synthase [Zoogloea sp.]MDD3353876.1 FAD-dependent thymidylate synthase [Zoogloea sp.]